LEADGVREGPKKTWRVRFVPHLGGVKSISGEEGREKKLCKKKRPLPGGGATGRLPVYRNSNVKGGQMKNKQEEK